MRSFDYYEPSGKYVCAVCNAPYHEWRGKDGPCGQFVFRQGVAGAITQRVEDDSRLSTAEISAQRLPDKFVIYARCFDCPLIAEMHCSTSDGVWQYSPFWTFITGDDQLWSQPGESRRVQSK